MRITLESIAGLNVTVMGLGLHGGGLASVRFFAERGAFVTATDLRDETTLRPTLDKLADLDVRFVLGRHDIEDFRGADLVIKNPAVRRDSPYLNAARRIETDISIFLQLHEGPVYAVTGTKGKSTTASAIHHVLKSTDSRSLLGGNITVSPLNFVSGDSGASGQSASAPVVLELSSWQLADLRGRNVLHPEVALITNILRDHQNHYASMEDYVSDKMVILEGQESGAKAVVNYDDPFLSRSTAAPGVALLPFSKTPLPPALDGGFLTGGGGVFRYHGEERTILDATLLKGDHNRINMLSAAVCCVCNGVPAEVTRRELATFAGVEHRLEFVRTLNGVEFYNDSAATIPDATIAAVDSFDRGVTLIAGGTDKELDFGLFAGLGRSTKGIYLLAGDATDKMTAVLDAAGVPYRGPFSSLEILMECIMREQRAGDIVVFSPGCASFGMFKNEFDRGTKYKTILKELTS